ncbi:DUF2252 domain-containing protein [Cupriavidus sp. IDO]|uniref:DUF2252 domain-containing protein n=1 Tax=Cupriavidus sp. IDO TaxID=1539142 RepID=UPI0005794A84|nr:DUF2252 domain-containing protein [Cupriavidus sp. IDO]KWR89761.1 hypothetical protein RM96_12630 [Cupriavidus sp. IDO]
MEAPEIPEVRRDNGKSVRRHVPRGAHTAIGNVDRDPVELLELSSEGRVPRLVPLRYGRMIESPFAFYRGSAIVQAHDLAGTPNSGLHMQICGDCHLANFGGFASPERALIFDLNDFDETSFGPWEWDLKRVAASFIVAARHLRHSPGVADDLVYQLVRSYQSRMQSYAEMSILDTWYDRITFDRLLEEETSPVVQKRIRRGIERAADRTHESLLPKLAERVGDRWIILDAPPALFHVRGKQTLFDKDDDWMTKDDAEATASVEKVFKEYLATLAPDRRELLSHFTRHDVAFKVVGVGSVGTRCLIQLMIDRHDKPLFLQVKEASRSVVARYFKGPAVTHEGRRVVEGQRLMQAASDLFLGWGKGPFGRHFYFRQLRDMKLSPQIELMDAELLGKYAALCGWVLARGHAKAGGLAAEITGYLGRSDRMAETMVAYSNAYADQVEKDYERFVAACRSGRLEARTDADMAADFRV